MNINVIIFASIAIGATTLAALSLRDEKASEFSYQKKPLPVYRVGDKIEQGAVQDSDVPRIGFGTKSAENLVQVRDTAYFIDPIGRLWEKSSDGYERRFTHYSVSGGTPPANYMAQLDADNRAQDAEYEKITGFRPPERYPTVIGGKVIP